MYNITTFIKNIFQYQTANFKNAKTAITFAPTYNKQTFVARLVLHKASKTLITLWLQRLYSAPGILLPTTLSCSIMQFREKVMGWEL